MILSTPVNNVKSTGSQYHLQIVTPPECPVCFVTEVSLIETPHEFCMAALWMHRPLCEAVEICLPQICMCKNIFQKIHCMTTANHHFSETCQTYCFCELTCVADMGTGCQQEVHFLQTCPETGIKKSWIEIVSRVSMDEEKTRTLQQT